MNKIPGRVTTSFTIDASAFDTLVFYCDFYNPKKNRSRLIERLLREFFSKEEIVNELRSMGWPQDGNEQKKK